MEIINLDMTPSTVTPNAHAGQYDSARTVRFMLKNGGVPFTLAGTETITAEITRSDNTEVTANVENTSSNYVDVVFDDTVCTVKGLYACELRIKDGGVDIGSKNFALLVQRDPYDNKNVHVETVGPADICTFETTLAEPLQSVIVDIVATGGYDADTQTAHPINGYTEANITRCGVNLFDEDNVYSAFKIANNRFKGTAAQISNVENSLSKYIGQTVTISCFLDLTVQPSPSRIYITSTINGTTYTSADVIQGNSGVVSLTVTPATANDIFKINWGSGGSNYFEFGSIQIEKGTTASDFTPYNGQTYTIAFGQTVYGGVLDVTRGKLHVTHGYADFDGSADENWTMLGSGSAGAYCMRINVSDRKTNTPLKANYLESILPAATWGDYDSFISYGISGKEIYTGIRNITSVSDWKTYLSSNHLTVVYELETPFDIDLTPEVISAVVGTNNVFADCGDIAVEYLDLL